MDAMAPDEMDQDHRQKSGREELDQIKAKEQEIRAKEQEIRAKEQDIRAKEQEIRELREEIREVERVLGTAPGTKVRKPLEAKLQFVREEVSSIRQEISKLGQQILNRDQQISSLRQEISSVRSVQEAAASAEQFSKRPKTAEMEIQLFVQSAAESYKKWERDYQLALSKVGEDTGEMRRLFLELKSDPLCNFEDGILLWVRECYTDMKDILLAAEPSRRFTILGTSGIGKSLFTVFWICYRATLKEKVVWKQGEARLYLLDFSGEPSAKAYSPVGLHHPDIQEVLTDKNAWLVIDGRQAENLVCTCKVVQACSMRKENYKEYAKNQRVIIQYFPVWEEEEVLQFLDEFEQYRLKYKNMDVPVRDDALRYFGKIGGVARYVLCGRKVESRLQHVVSAVGDLSGDSCLHYFAGKFEGEKSDALVHIKCEGRGKEKYSSFTYGFASSDVRFKFRERFEQVSKGDVVRFLKSYANSTEAGNCYGYVFELVAHVLFKGGGEFKMKRVMQGGDPKGEEVARLKVPNPLKVVFFESLQNFPPFEADTYYRPQAANFRSIDAILHPDYLLQYFSYKSGVHGYMVKGLQDVCAALGLKKFKVCSCVPIDKYDETGFQPWLSAEKRLYKAALPQIIKDSEQYVIGVDYNNFSS